MSDKKQEIKGKELAVGKGHCGVAGRSKNLMIIYTEFTDVN